VTKSGTNSLHGSGFEFLRNTALNAKNYFSLPTDKTPVFRQNQFGGTLGGPIRKDKTFFVDYQGTRQTQAPTVNVQMPSLANFNGDFSDSAAALTSGVHLSRVRHRHGTGHRSAGVVLQSARRGGESDQTEANNDAGLAAHPSGRWATNCPRIEFYAPARQKTQSLSAKGEEI
jgi:hypothetical protein